MLELGEHGAWVPPVLKSVARDGTGVPELRARIAAHRAFLEGAEGAGRRRARTRHRVETLVHYPTALTELPAFADCESPPCPVAEAASRTLLSLPLHPRLADADVTAVACAVGTFVKGSGSA